MLNKILVYIFIFFLFLSSTFAYIKYNVVWYEGILEEFQDGNLDTAIEKNAAYIFYFDGFKDCRSYRLQSNMLSKKVKTERIKKLIYLYREIAELCIFLQKGDKDKANKLISKFDLDNYKSFSDTPNMYYLINKLIYEYLIYDINLIKNIFNFPDFINKDEDGQVYYDLKKEAMILLSRVYIEKEMYKEWIKISSSIGDYSNYSSIISLLNFNEIEFYKDRILSLYGKKFYDYFYAYHKLYKWVIIEHELEKEKIKKYYDIVNNYHMKNKEFLVNTFGNDELKVYFFRKIVYDTILSGIFYGDKEDFLSIYEDDIKELPLENIYLYFQNVDKLNGWLRAGELFKKEDIKKYYNYVYNYYIKNKGSIISIFGDHELDRFFFVNIIYKSIIYQIFSPEEEDFLHNHKDKVIFFYGEKFYLYLYRLSELNKWLKTGKVLKKEDIKKYYDYVYNYYAKNKKFIVDTFGDYKLEETIFIQIIKKIKLQSLYDEKDKFLENLVKIEKHIYKEYDVDTTSPKINTGKKITDYYTGKKNITKYYSGYHVPIETSETEKESKPKLTKGETYENKIFSFKIIIYFLVIIALLLIGTFVVLRKRDNEKD